MKIDACIALLKGATTYVPGVYPLFRQRHMNLSEAVRAEYSYGVWLKHLTLLNRTVHCGVPRIIAELGPGDTLGVGVAALLSGAERYIGVDTIPYAANCYAVNVAQGLFELFRRRVRVEVNGWPDFGYLLDSKGFPSAILDDSVLSRMVEPDRVASIIRDVGRVTMGGESETPFIDYCAPFSAAQVREESVDFVISHSVLEHVTDIRSTLQSAHRWLRPGGLMSHQYDLSSHGIMRSWDGHRTFGASTWEVVVGARPFMINRLPHSRIVEEVELAGFEILVSERLTAEPTLAHKQLCRQWQAYTEEDVHTSGGFIQARKPT
ncbi:MAG: methyltransferase domain-containing protein [Rhizomicrobium sp.]|jgi:SAM-dependent methyltransferase